VQDFLQFVPVWCERGREREGNREKEIGKREKGKGKREKKEKEKGKRGKGKENTERKASGRWFCTRWESCDQEL